MEDKHPELKKQRRRLLELLAGLLINLCIFNWHTFRGLGFKAFRSNDFVVQSLAAIGVTICLWLVAQHIEPTTLGIGDATAKKLE